MDEAQALLWQQVQDAGQKMHKEFRSCLILERRYMLAGREVAVLFDFGSQDPDPSDCYYVDEALSIRDFFLLQKDRD